MRGKLKVVFIISLIISVTTLTYLVMATLGGGIDAQIKVFRPGSSTILNSANTTFIINCTWAVNDSQLYGIMNALIANTTFYINDTSTWRSVTGTVNATNYTISGNSSGHAGNASWVNVTVSGLTEANASVAINCTIGNNTALAHITEANLSSTITIDYTPPAVTVTQIAGINWSNRVDTDPGNYSDGLIHFNVTITDAITGVNNIILNFSNGTGKQENLTNLTVTNIPTGISNTTYNLSASINISTYEQGNYTLQIIANDTAGNTNKSSTSGSIYIDHAIPAVNPANISEPDAGHNYSQNIIVNVTVVDNSTAISNGSGINSVKVIVWNTTGNTGSNANKTYTATKEGSTNQYSVAINSSHFPDTQYNITIFANDSAKNTNKSAQQTYAVRFDNTAPSISYSCTPTTGIDVGDTVTCTCSASDSGAGLNGSVSYDASPSTTASGTFTVYCSAYDLAANHNRASVSYSVQGAQGGGTGGGSGGGTTVTTSKKVQSWTKITPGAATIMKNFDATYGIKQIQITVNNEAQNVQVTVTKYAGKPADVSVEKTGKVYTYLQIETDNLGEKLNKATLDLKVSKSWLTDNNIDKENVALFKFQDGEWKELTTTYVEEDTSSYYYKADVSSFSYFALGEKVVAEEEGEGAGEGEGEILGIEIGGLPIWLIIVVVIVIVALVGYVIYRRKQ